MLVDTHTHLYLDAFDDVRNEVIERAIENGVNKLMLPNIDSSTYTPMMEVCMQYPNNCFPMIGLHPTSVKDNWEEEIEFVRKKIEAEKFVGIGETGIDLYWDTSFLEAQKLAFTEHIKLAKENSLPLIIHARDSFDEIFSIIDEYNDDSLFGIFHCFGGSYLEAQRIIDYGGFKLGIGGVLTFRKSGLDKIVSNIDISHIVLETDSPFLAPVPFRGKRNESAYLIHIAEKLAELYDISIEEVNKRTTENALRIFSV
jgi:TatD DNase family protein